MGSRRRVFASHRWSPGNLRKRDRILDGKQNSMNLREAREEIESADFAARVNVASGLSTLLEASKLEGAVVALWNEMISEEVTLRVLNRIRELAEESVDSRYRNPRDTALAVYLWLLVLRSPGLCDIGAE